MAAKRFEKRGEFLESDGYDLYLPGEMPSIPRIEPTPMKFNVPKKPEGDNS